MTNKDRKMIRLLVTLALSLSNSLPLKHPKFSSSTNITNARRSDKNGGGNEGRKQCYSVRYEIYTQRIGDLFKRRKIGVKALLRQPVLFF
jgi:hypothetical protein